MGLFNLGKKYSDIENELLKQYAVVFEQMALPNPKKQVKSMLDTCIEESKKENTYYLPQNMGDLILDKNLIKSDSSLNKLVEIFRKELPKKRADGVRDKDIRWWWNLNDIERRMMIAIDDVYALTTFISLRRDQGFDENRAGKETRKSHVIYGHPEDRKNATGNDIPLPYELKDRINIYIEKEFKTNPEKLKSMIKGMSSMNALIRKEIREGKI